MKIGILTYQYAMNYGAVLQVFALKSYLSDCGYEVHIINYDSSYLYAQNRSLKAKVVSATLNFVKSFMGAKKKKKRFDSFRRDKLYLANDVMSEKKSLEEYLECNHFDAVIVGSDQVWNPEINGNDDVYYLNIANNIQKISYAASFGVTYISDESQEHLKECLERFDAISVRENTGREIIADMGLDSTVVLDPVFLPEKAMWEKIASELPLVKDPYILCYILPGDNKVERKIETTARQLHIKTGKKVVFLGRKEYKRFSNDGKDYVSASPEEFVNLFRYADIVITNSFHGTAFSVIFEKCFCSIINKDFHGEKQLSSRLTDLLHDLNADNRLFSVNDDVSVPNEMDYSEINGKLKVLKKKSEEFLDSALQEIGRE